MGLINLYSFSPDKTGEMLLEEVEPSYSDAIPSSKSTLHVPIVNVSAKKMQVKP